MLTEPLAQKTRLAMTTVVATVAGRAVICSFTVWCCISLVNRRRRQIYVPDSDIPFLMEHAQLEANFIMEAKTYIQPFRRYFFNLSPDNDYVKRTLGKAMYIADGTTPKQKQALDENGFYLGVISLSAVCTIMCNSILLDEHERKFTYYDTRLIKQRTKDLECSMVTAGYIENVPRTRNNSRELMITNWRTIEDKDSDY